MIPDTLPNKMTQKSFDINFFPGLTKNLSSPTSLFGEFGIVSESDVVVAVICHVYAFSRLPRVLN